MKGRKGGGQAEGKEMKVEVEGGVRGGGEMGQKREEEGKKEDRNRMGKL